LRQTLTKYEQRSSNEGSGVGARQLQRDEVGEHRQRGAQGCTELTQQQQQQQQTISIIHLITTTSHVEQHSLVPHSESYKLTPLIPQKL